MDGAGETVDETSSPLKSIMKWVGIVAAVLSLVAGVRQFLTLTAESTERERRIGELLATGAAQQQARDYPQAWATLETALGQAEQGNLLAKLTRRLGERRQQVRVAQENLAMQWLQNTSVPQGQTFSSIVDKVLPVLHRGTLQASGARIGDMSWYAKALESDPANPYAHAFSGHWKIWSNESVDAAMSEFAEAVAGNRERPFVCGVQISALLNRSGVDARVALVRVANDMRRSGESIDGRLLRELRTVYHAALNDEQPARPAGGRGDQAPVEMRALG